MNRRTCLVTVMSGNQVCPKLCPRVKRFHLSLSEIEREQKESMLELRPVTVLASIILCFLT